MVIRMMMMALLLMAGSAKAEEVNLFAKPDVGNSPDLSTEFDPLQDELDKVETIGDVPSDEQLYRNEEQQLQQQQRQERVLYDRQQRQAEEAEQARQSAIQAQQNAVRALQQTGGG